MICLSAYDSLAAGTILTHDYTRISGDVSTRRHAVYQVIDADRGVSVNDGGYSAVNRNIQYDISVQHYDTLKELLVVGDCLLSEKPGYVWRGLLVEVAYISDSSVRFVFIPTEDLLNPVVDIASKNITVTAAIKTYFDIVMGEN